MDRLRIRKTRENIDHLESINRGYVVDEGAILVFLTTEEKIKWTSPRKAKKGLGL